MKNLIIAFALLLPFQSFCQLADGSIAPDFVLEDYYGNEHHLYEYLNADKTVILEIFAAHCPSCWNYHQANTLKDLYNAYGPEGTDELMVLALEHDDWNGENEFMGIGDPWNTAGNWLDGTPYPLFNVEGSDRSVFDDYNVTGYPVVYKICPNKIVERFSTSLNVAEVYELASGCESVLSTQDNFDVEAILYNSDTRELEIGEYQKVEAIRIVSQTGQMVQKIENIDQPSIGIKPLSAGIYFFEFQTESGTAVRKFYLK